MTIGNRIGWGIGSNVTTAVSLPPPPLPTSITRSQNSQPKPLSPSPEPLSPAFVLVAFVVPIIPSRLPCDLGARCTSEEKDEMGRILFALMEERTLIGIIRVSLS